MSNENLKKIIQEKNEKPVDGNEDLNILNPEESDKIGGGTSVPVDPCGTKCGQGSKLTTSGE